jgi:hypothetical protein
MPTSARSDFNDTLFDLATSAAATTSGRCWTGSTAGIPGYDGFRNAARPRDARGLAARPDDLRLLDLKRDLEPDWFQRPDMAGYVFYIDRFCGVSGQGAGHAGLPEGPGHHLRAFHALPEAPSGRQRRRLFRHGLRPDQPGLRHDGGFRGRGPRLPRRGDQRVHRPGAEPYGQGTRLGEEGAAGRPEIRRLLPDVRGRHPAEAVREDPGGGLPDNAPGNFTWYDDGRGAGSGPPSTNTSGT